MHTGNIILVAIAAMVVAYVVAMSPNTLLAEGQKASPRQADTPRAKQHTQKAKRHLRRAKKLQQQGKLGKAKQHRFQAKKYRNRASDVGDDATLQTTGTSLGQIPNRRMTKQERKATRKQRRAAKRARAKARALRSLRGKKITPAFREEFRRHARRTARLQRIREMAGDSGDRKMVAKVDALTVRENARHDRFLAKVAAKSTKTRTTQGKSSSP